MTRILMTADAVGGVWAYAMELGRGLQRRGIEITLAALGPPPTLAQRAGAASIGIEVVDIPGRLEWMDEPWDDVDSAGAQLLDLACEVQPDVVHLNGYSHAALPWSAPVVVVAHSCVCSWWRAVYGESVPPRFDEYHARVARGLHSAALVVAPSHAMLLALENEYGRLPSARVVANGSDFQPAPAVDREPIVFSAGRIWDEAKNIEALCAAASSLAWPVFVAGDCRRPGGEALEPYGARYLGTLDREAMREWCARASIYVMPARYEPFGLSVLEAARSGCALVLGDIRSLRENWDGAAVFVPPDNRRALATAIQALAEDDVRRRKLAETASGRSRSLTAARMVDGYIDCYMSLPVGVA